MAKLAKHSVKRRFNESRFDEFDLHSLSKTDDHITLQLADADNRVRLQMTRDEAMRLQAALVKCLAHNTPGFTFVSHLG